MWREVEGVLLIENRFPREKLAHSRLLIFVRPLAEMLLPQIGGKAARSHRSTSKAASFGISVIRKIKLTIMTGTGERFLFSKT
jgi:hypothetical protein